MSQYILSFFVYTFAMIGLLVVGVVVCKKTGSINLQRKSSAIKIIDMIKLPDKKTLYLIGCKNNLFLIASSNDNVNLISKLDDDKKNEKQEQIEKYLSETKENFTDGEVYQLKKNQNMKSLLKELSDLNKTKRGDN